MPAPRPRAGGAPPGPLRNAVAVANEDPDALPGAQAVEDRLASALGVEQTAPAGAPGPRAWWRGLDPRTKRRLKIAGVVSLAFVILVSVLLARFLQTENIERDDDLALIEAQTRGDVQGMLRSEEHTS